MIMVPTTLQECFQALADRLAPDEQVDFLNMDRADLGQTHHYLGQWIRNNWGLWSDSPLCLHMKSLGFIHADDMSSSIIKEFWLRLRGEPSEISQDVERYKKFWDKKGVV